MQFCRYFIDRPIFAAVLSILVTLAGAIALFRLPIAQFPAVAPPTVQVDCNYPGASSLVVAQTIAAPIEQQVNGVEEMLYMSSQSTSDGSYTLTVTFKPGVDLNLAQVLVQNRVSLARPQLPDVVRATGVTTKKRAPDILLTISINSPDNRYDQLYISNYALLHLRDEIARIPGISEVLLFGQRDYSMRVWIDPEQLSTRNLTANDVVNAIREQNFQVAAGSIGQPPHSGSSTRQIPLAVVGRLTNETAFEDIVVRADHDQLIRIRDIGRVELGARSQDINNRFDGKPTVGLAIFQLSDANALTTADLIKAKIEELSKDFPEGLAYEIGYDTTPFIRESIDEVFKALRDATILVALVVLVFLQGWRPAIIPLIAVPVAIVGTFAAMAVVGFSINNLTLFGLVLAIGIVVDDAIVVVEAVQHHISQGLNPREAAIRAMDEVAGPVVAVGLVLSSVFIPCAFITGIVGEFFRQFALTIAISTILSMLNSLTLSPALAAILLQGKDDRPDILTRVINFLFGWFFAAFDWSFRTSTSFYTRFVGQLLRIPVLVLIVYGGLLFLTGWGFNQLPKGFIPSQDMGYLIASIQLPDSAAAGRTRDTVARIEEITLKTPGVKNVNSIAGNSFILSSYGSNFGSMFIILDSFHHRKGHAGQSAEEIAASLRKSFAKDVPEALVSVFPPPAVRGLGRAGGFRLMVEDREDLGLKELQKGTDELIAKMNATGKVQGAFTVFKTNSPQIFADIDRQACLQLNVPLQEAFAALQATMGSRYVNDFNRFGRTWQVVVQADTDFRNDLADLKRIKVRNSHGEMVPLAAVCTLKEVSNPLVISRYNMYPAATVNGNVAPGFSTGETLDMVEQLAASELPIGLATEWSELSYMERQAGNTGMFVFYMAIAFVFLVLAALYESWALPLAVILVVPMCILSSITGVAYAAMDINVFTQIGFVVLIGLACKNAILIVEFARSRRHEGATIREATLEACHLRLRPILMTSCAFILGVIPLILATGAGAEMRRTLGVAVFSGMLGVTCFGILLTPVFFYVIEHLSEAEFFRSSKIREPAQWVLDVIRLKPLWRGAQWSGRHLISISDKIEERFRPHDPGSSSSGHS